MVMIRKRILMPQNLTKKTIKKPQIIAKKAPKKPQKAKKGRKLKKKTEKARIFLGHSVQDCSKRTLVYMGIFFIEAVKKSPGIKILSLLITFFEKTSLQGATAENMIFFHAHCWTKK